MTHELPLNTFVAKDIAAKKKLLSLYVSFAYNFFFQMSETISAREAFAQHKKW